MDFSQTARGRQRFFSGREHRRKLRIEHDERQRVPLRSFLDDAPAERRESVGDDGIDAERVAKGARARLDADDEAAFGSAVKVFTRTESPSPER